MAAAGLWDPEQQQRKMILKPGSSYAMYAPTWSQSTFSFLCATRFTASWVLWTGTSGSRGSASSLASSMIWTTDRIVGTLMSLLTSVDNHVYT